MIDAPTAAVPDVATETAAADSDGQGPIAILGLARLARPVFMGHDVGALDEHLVGRVQADFFDASALLDLSILWQLTGRKAQGLELQRKALELARHYRIADLRSIANPQRRRPTILALMAPGDFLANTPLEFIVEGLDVTLDLYYLVPGEPIPARFPDHDLALIAIGYNEENAPLLEALGHVVDRWPGPIINHPRQILGTSREGVAAVLRGIPGLLVPKIARLTRSELACFANGLMEPEDFLDGHGFPIIARPLDSHAGAGLHKLDGPSDVAAYLANQADEAFYIAEFVDYRGPDGLFRKWRIAVIEGHPFICHMALNDRWMIHYLNAGMTESADKRAAEARSFAEFDTAFVGRHGATLAEIAQRMGLDYFTIDCSVTAGGELLLFEADNAMVIHDMDPPTMYPYKGPHMRQVFARFGEFLGRRSRWLTAA